MPLHGLTLIKINIEMQIRFHKRFKHIVKYLSKKWDAAGKEITIYIKDTHCSVHPAMFANFKTGYALHNRVKFPKELHHSIVYLFP